MRQIEMLRRKRHESRASTTYKLFLRTLCDSLSLPEQLAERAAASVLCALEQRLTNSEGRHLEAQLPRKLTELLVRCERHERLRPRDIGRSEFLGMVAGDLGIRIDHAETIVRGVFQVLTLQVSPGQLQSVLSMLPADLRELWPPIPEDRRRHRTARPSRRDESLERRRQYGGHPGGR